jgi:bacterioferritin
MTESAAPSRAPAATGRLSGVDDIRRRAGRDITAGAVTPSYPEDKATIVRLLNEALATEIVCWLRYKRHYYATRGIHAKVAAAEFLEHAREEQEHADRLAERIVQLGEDPDLDPRTLVQRSHAEYHAGTGLKAMLEADLLAERIAIESYREIVAYIGDRDPTTRRLFEEILAAEEHHAEDIVDLLAEPRG